MGLKILHPEGPNHKPELNGAKAPAQGDLPMLETNNTELVVRNNGPFPWALLALSVACRALLGSPGVAVTPKAVAKEQTKTSLSGQCCTDTERQVALSL